MTNLDPSDVSSKCYVNDGNQSLLSLVPQHVREALDIGCGSGANARILSAKGITVDAITLSEVEAKESSNVCRSCFVADLEVGLPEGLGHQYDLVLCSHVLEHLRWPDRLLKSLHPLIEPTRGTLLVALPNMLYYKNRAKLLFGHCEYTDHGLMDASHFRWYTYSSARKLLESAGYQVNLHHADGSAPLALFRRVGCRTLVEAIDSAATRLLPGLFGYQIVLLATPVTRS